MGNVAATNEGVRDEIGKAIQAHQQWRDRLTRSIQSGTLDRPVQDIGRDDLCQFGKWLRTVPQMGLATGAIRKAMALHEEFHRAAGDVAGRISRNQPDEAFEILEYGAFAEASKALVGSMHEWIEILDEEDARESARLRKRALWPKFGASSREGP